MLIVDLPVNESLMIDDTKITMFINKRDKVRLCIDAPTNVVINYDKEHEVPNNVKKN